MQFDVIFSGFGGQGVLFAGRLLAYTAMDEGYQVTWLPSYGFGDEAWARTSPGPSNGSPSP